jgi:hypothetical protein
MTVAALRGVNEFSLDSFLLALPIILMLLAFYLYERRRR